MSPTPDPRPAADTPLPGRDATGRFTKGNPGGPGKHGNPFARRAAALRKAFCEAITQRQLRELARSLHERALDGDTAAARLLLSYSLGRPSPQADPDTLDRHEMGVFAAATEMQAQLQELWQGMLPATLAKLARDLLPILDEAHKGQLAAKLQQPPQPADDTDEEEDEYGEEYDDEGEEWDDEGGEDGDYGGEPDEAPAPQWRVTLAGSSPPPEAAEESNGRHSGSQKSAVPAPPDTAGHAPAQGAVGAASRLRVPIGPSPAVENRRDQRPPRPDGPTRGEGPDRRETPPPPPGWNGSPTSY
jgi:hypothetical protein